MEEMKSNDVYLDSDGTLGISADVDISKVKRILLTQEGTHYGSMYSQNLPDTNVGEMKCSEMPNTCNFKPGDKFILEIGKRQLDEFEIAGTDYYIKIYLLKMLTPYKPEVRTQMSSADCVSRKAAIDAVTSICDSCDSGYCGDCRVNFPGGKDARKVLEDLPSAQPDHIVEVSKKADADLISRADVEQTVEDNILCYTHSDRPIDQDPDTECHKAIRTALKMLRKDLRKLPPAQLERRWIPCSKRLPEDGKWCLFTDGVNMSVERYKEDAMDHFFPEGRWFRLEDTVAWMPLPEPYQAERREE